jgi:hypothetical protein
MKLTQQDKGRAARRAAALIRHWQRDDIDGVLALLAEMDHAESESPEPMTSLICALLDITENLIKAARDGNEDTYLDYVLGAASIDEVAQPGDQDGQST